MKTKIEQLNKNVQNNSNLGFKKGMLGSLSKKEANIEKGKGNKKRKTEETPKNNL